MFVLTGSCMPRSYFNICEFCDLYNFKHCKLLKGGLGGGGGQGGREGNKGRAVFLIFSDTLYSLEFCHRNKWARLRPLLKNGLLNLALFGKDANEN